MVKSPLSCNSNEFLNTNSQCQALTVCPAGQELQGATANSDGVCQDCSDGTFSTDGSACIGHNTCALGFRLLQGEHRDEDEVRFNIKPKLDARYAWELPQ